MFYNVIYVLSLFICLIISFYHDKKDVGLKVFPVLLSLSFITEIIVYFLYFIVGLRNGEYFFLYHLYIPLDYILLSFFFIHNFSNRLIKSIVIISVPIFVCFCILFSFWKIGIHRYPGIILNVEGILLIVWCIIKLLTIEVKLGIQITALPIFWICTGLLIYNLGGFMFNGFYNSLIENKSSFANEINQFFNKLFNVLLYIFFSKGLLCSNQMKKSMLQS